MKRTSILIAAAVLAASPAYAQVANIKIVTDANPDYSDMESMVHSITANWKTDQEKMFALFYWDHFARRQTAPMCLHGFELTDPIRQFNDYGFTMCSTITGIKCSEWNYMGYPCRYWDISLHTVPDVWYDGAFHHYDNSLSMMYTLPDGKTIAGVDDIDKTLAGPETGGKEVKGYIALYHALTGTSPDGYCEGADTERPLDQIVHDFNPKGLKYRYYHYGQERGHRYILNLRDGEVYTRFYSKQDGTSSDPAYYVPNKGEDSSNAGKDPEAANTRYHIRGNGDRTFSPGLDAARAYSTDNIAAAGKALQPAAAGKPAVVIYKVEGANVITSLKIHALAALASADDAASIAVSTTNGLQWADVWKADKAGENSADLKLINEVNGAYEVLVKVTLNAKANLKDAQLAAIAFDTTTELNSKTQPQLRLGKNTVYVGAGEQSESIVVWPELQGGKYKPYAVDEQNVVADDKATVWHGCLHLQQAGEGYVTFKVDAPTDITSVTYGGRLDIKLVKAHIDFLHSFDGGKTWKTDYSFTDGKPPFDYIHYETISDIPAGTKSVLFKYLLATNAGEMGTCSIYSVHMEVNHKLAAPSKDPMEVTFNWEERQKDYSTVKRSHTQLVEHLPATYAIDVGGYDQPIVDSLTVNLKGARPDVKYGYSDGKDAGGEKWVGQWATYGKDLAQGKPYTLSVPSGTDWGAGDPDGKKLTDGRVGSSYTGGVNFHEGAIWKPNANPEITVDLGDVQKCAAFRIHTLGYPFWDAMKGEIKDQIEVLVSADGKEFKSVGTIDPQLHWKDVAVNFMMPDDETLSAPNYFLPMQTPVDARFVKYKVTSPRNFGCTEVQVLDGFAFKPFDLKIALPDPATNGKAPPKPDVSPNARQWKPEELPATIGKPFKNPE